MHRNNFDGLRLLAALAVLVSHMFTLTGRPPPELWPDTPLGTVAVMAFFSMSGYLVSASWRHDPHLGRFLARRTLRVGPGLLVAWTALVSYMWTLGLPDGFTMNPVYAPNASLWTIPFEVQCYIVLAGCCLVMKRSALLLCLIALIGTRKMQGNWLTIFGLFFVVGALIDQFPKLRGNLATALIVTIGAYMLYRWGNPYYGMSLIVSALTIWVGTRSWPVLCDAGAKGDYSYGLYLYAYPVQQTLVMLLGAQYSFWGLLTGSVLVTGAIAWLSWTCVEAPALRFKPQGTLKVRTSDAPVHPVSPVTARTVVHAESSSDH
jgi:peptidoglycan/LPS O-acetylase OafA/YrhL